MNKAGVLYYLDTLPTRKLLVMMDRVGDVKWKFSDVTGFIKALYYFKNHSRCVYSSLVDMIAVHNPNVEKYEVICILSSIIYQKRVVLSYETSSVTRTICSFFRSAAWSERECWDMFGLMFIGNSDMRRLLTDYGFMGHPLKKDFPLTGYLELRYDEMRKNLVYEKVELSQELRDFHFSNPWQ